MSPHLPEEEGDGEEEGEATHANEVVYIKFKDFTNWYCVHTSL